MSQVAYCEVVDGLRRRGSLHVVLDSSLERRFKMKRLFLLIVVLAALLAACGGDDATGSTTTTGSGSAAPETTSVETTTTAAASTTTAAPDGFPVEVSSAAGPVLIETRPERIAALSATHVEMLFALGAGDQVVAGDLFSNYPEEADSLEKLDSFNLNVESVIALDPDLVIITFDPGDVVASLDAVGIPTLLLGTAFTLEDTYDQISVVGAATGHADAAAALVMDMQTEIKDIVASAGDAGTGATYYHETDPFGFYTPNSSSFIGQLYGLLGMVNIADEAPDQFDSGFPQLSPEFIITADPRVIFIGAEGETAETLAARDGWDSMTAVAAGDVVVLDGDIASRWGPRVVDLMQSIVDGLLDATS